MILIDFHHLIYKRITEIMKTFIAIVFMFKMYIIMGRNCKAIVIRRKARVRKYKVGVKL